MALYTIAAHKAKPQLLASHLGLGREVWITWDADAELYCLFASKDCDDPIGEADFVGAAQRIAREWFTELETN